MTLPALINDYQKKQTVSQLKKAYSVISQALVASQYDNGNMTEWNLNDIGAVGDGYENVIPDMIKKYFIPYLNVRFDCGLECERQRNVKRYRLNGEEWNWRNYFYYVVYLADGMIVAFMIDNSEGVWRIVYMYVDINGDKKPNISGRDIFTLSFASTTNKINFAGVGHARNYLLSSNSRNVCSKTGGSYSGDYCGAVIQYDNWEIKDDYPW